MTSKKGNQKSRHTSHVTRHLLGLPHRPPFVFVRKLVAREPGISAECETEFSRDDPMFAGHFPGDPLVPGVILTEALAQTAGIAAHQNLQQRFLLSGIRLMKFLHSVRPDQKIILRARKMAQVNQLLQFEVEAIVDGKQVAVGEIVLSAVTEKV